MEALLLHVGFYCNLMLLMLIRVVLSCRVSQLYFLFFFKVIYLRNLKVIYLRDREVDRETEGRAKGEGEIKSQADFSY